MPFPDFEATAPVMLRTLVERHGQRTFMVHGGERLSYAELEERSARLALGLLASGVGKGTPVGLLMPNGPDWVIAFFAVARIGALLVPINTFYKTRELAWALRHADVRTLLTVARFKSNHYLERLEACTPELAVQTPGEIWLRELPHLREVWVWGDCDRSWARPGAALDAAARRHPRLDRGLLREIENAVTPADPAIVIYTSGSTAEPRGAVHTHGALVRHSFNVNSRRDLLPDDRVWSPMPFFWVGGLVLSVLGTMHVGACFLNEEAFDPERTLEMLEREHATIASGWPHFGKAMADHPSFPRRDLSSLRAGNLDILPPTVRPADPDLRTNSLGMTETCGPHTYGTLNDPPETLRGSFGTAVDGVKHKVVDPESGVLFPPGVDGEICVRGYNLMQGFYKVEREQTFDADGFYHTGDGGNFDAAGFLHFKGRLGDMIKTAGANVSPGELEQVLESFPEIKEAFVVGVPDPARGQNVAAAIVLNHGRSLSDDAVRARLKNELASYKIPRHVFFYPDGSLPFTDSGKIDKRKLREILTARVAE